MLQNKDSTNGGSYLCLNCRTIVNGVVIQYECNRYCEFESTCSQKCHALEKPHFKIWIMDNYADDSLFLINFVSTRCRPTIMREDLSYCIDLITSYIYEKYKFTIIYTNIPIENNYIQGDTFQIRSYQPTIINVSANEEDYDSDSEPPSLIDIDSDSDYDDMPSLLDPLENTINLDEFVDIMRQRFLIKFNITSMLDEFKDDTITNYCCICFEDKSKDVFVKLGCDHEFCKECFTKALKSNRKNSECCCYCRREIKTIISRKTEIYEEIETLII